MFKFLRKTSLYLLAIPVLLYSLGFVSNQVVLLANHDRFPVMWSDYKVAEYDRMLHEKALSKDKEVAEQAKFDIYALESEGFIDDVHCVMTSDTHLNALADIVDLGSTYSIGDGLLYLGEWLFGFVLFLFVFDVVRKLRKLSS
jgi:hypothetical protein